MNNISQMNITWRFILFLMGFAIAVIGWMFLSLNIFFADHILQGIREDVMFIASLAAGKVDVALHENLLSPEQEGSSDYLAVKKALKDMADLNPLIDSIYTLRKTDKAHFMTFVVDSTETADKDGNGVIDEGEESAHLGEEYDTSLFPEMERGFSQVAADYEVTADKWGYWISGYAPIKDASGKAVAMIGVDYNAENYWATLDFLRKRMLIIASLSLLLCAIFGLWGGAIFERENRLIMREHDLLLAVMDSSPIGIFVTDQSGTIKSSNACAAEMLGVESAQTLTGMNVIKLPGLSAAKLEKRFKEALKGKVLEFEAACVPYFGKKNCWYRYTVKPMLEEDGRTIDRLLVMLEDMSELDRLKKSAKTTLDNPADAS